MWKSTKFWTLVIDIVVSLVLYFVGKYSTPSILSDVEKVIYAIQAIVIALLGGPVLGAWLKDKAELRELDKEQSKASIEYDYQVIANKAKSGKVEVFE